MKSTILGALLTLISALAQSAELRLGLIGTDTSHAPAFARILNDPSDPEHIAGARVTMAFKGGSPDIEESAKRVDGYAAELQQKWNVKFVAAIADMCPDVDGILLESVDARPHLQQFREALRCGKPIFVDKPLAATLSEAQTMAALAAKDGVAWFSASALRFSDIQDLNTNATTGVIVWAPGPMEPHHNALDLTWYGIHGVEMLYTAMGAGCVEVSRISSLLEDVITGRWSDGRLGVVHLERPYGKYGGIAFLKDEKILVRPDLKVSYVPLVKQIVAFMRNRVPPFPNSITLEIFGFMDAAQKSLALNGAAIKLAPESR